MKETKEAYRVIYKGQKFYFEFSLVGFELIQKMAKELNTTLSFKCVRVDINKELLG